MNVHVIRCSRLGSMLQPLRTAPGIPGSRSTQHEAALLTKTPGRSVLKGRSALQENSVRKHGSQTTGKDVISLSPLKPSTLRTSDAMCYISYGKLIYSNGLEPERLFKRDASATKLKPAIVPTHASRPLLDKTPFQNRTRNANAPFFTPAPHSTKLYLLDPQSADSQLLSQGSGSLRPSSTRKHIRIPRSASKSFETPISKGNPYEADDISIEVPEVVEKKQVIGEEDYDEIEYMPPSAICEFLIVFTMSVSEIMVKYRRMNHHSNFRFTKK
jgi:hypothetical protein